MPAPEEPAENDRNDPIQAAIHAALRERFRSFLNDDARYRKFITACNDLYSKDRELRYWQQPVWDLFIKEYPEYASLDAPAIRNAFHVCHVHLIPLKQVEVPIYKGVWDISYIDEAERARSENAPYSPGILRGQRVLGQSYPHYILVLRRMPCLVESVSGLIRQSNERNEELCRLPAVIKKTPQPESSP
ncbi:hypothetical protein [Gimesia chilikensis]|uniref:Uncharacterized protein n=1 Tax=Gimesia chilikensis TaxID=2605989 RepID=A0A517PL31_9PLAN|nr:hypothetical protein [Gimesia chilikensis]QDT20080.1 hypothetical protein HG66A1_18650 [Gimesia chilikensis]